jgi:hypothetical protein
MARGVPGYITDFDACFVLQIISAPLKLMLSVKVRQSTAFVTLFNRDMIENAVDLTGGPY